ncbi:MAG: hypothetical protein ACD_60C00095G0001 [uncultured bacterium]|nr:MAG: hypothetical protein ACD_60C00095G0001 [uncultured bacterium]
MHLMKYCQANIPLFDLFKLINYDKLNVQIYSRFLGIRICYVKFCHWVRLV